MAKYQEYKQLQLTRLAAGILEYWKQNDIFNKSIKTREGKPSYVFFEGPPSANGMPGIHHVMARAIKDIFCRYQTQKGFQVKRKAGWDTHGLPVEIGVEKKLGITKEDIGKSISITDYNRECRQEVMKYKDKWDELTVLMGYWVDLSDPYITFDNKYIESVWNLLQRLYNKDMLYKGFTIQPYSPAAGTGLSTHELNQPGCYRDVKDNTLVAQFKVVRDQRGEFLFENNFGELYFLAWTTTPWTLPSNTGLAVNEKIDYVKVKTFNPYTGQPQTVILAKSLLPKWFNEKNAGLDFEAYKPGDKNVPWQEIAVFKGSELAGVRYEQLMPYVQPGSGDSFRVVGADFVTVEDGTGIVHIAPSFGADDFRTGKIHNLGSLTLVDKTGRFVPEMGEFAGRFVKPQYNPDYTAEKEAEMNVDIDIIVKLKKENKAFKAEKYEHSYPHCWRTDKPVLYYPLDSWFVRTTAMKDRMIELNKTINWKPESTGSGRFGNWLENMLDWNLSRSRYWGIPIPIWTSEDRDEQICIGSIEQLVNEIEKSVAAGFMKENPCKAFKVGDFSKDNYATIDIHRPYVDEIVLVSASGKPMHREPDLIDVWFDSGSMPYAQWHYPFENKEIFEKNFPADFIAEGVDQTRGWFYTLHAIATMAFDSVAFKTVVSNGLVLDKNGNKMSKRLGNAVDPFETLAKYGPDATRFYMITNSQPWDNLKFDLGGIEEVTRKFFGTLHNTYSFFSLYANIDGFSYKEAEIPLAERPELDRWILSELNSLVKEVDEAYADYEPTRAGRAMERFVDEHLSNWYVRLSRRRFWKGEYSNDKISAYQTLYTCLEKLAMLLAPISPFYAEQLYKNLNDVSGRNAAESVHLTDFPAFDGKYFDHDLEQRMELAQKISSMVLSLRKKSGNRVRQPLQKIIIPSLGPEFENHVANIRDLVMSETNIKEIEVLDSRNDFLVKKAKPDFKKLGPRFGKQMKAVADVVSTFGNPQIGELESEGRISINLGGETAEVLLDEVEIFTEDIPGWIVANEGRVTVALDITLTGELLQEGLARDFVNRVQNLRKESGFEVTDTIKVQYFGNEEVQKAIINNFSYICNEILATELGFSNSLDTENSSETELTEGVNIRLKISKN